MHHFIKFMKINTIIILLLLFPVANVAQKQDSLSAKKETIKPSTTKIINVDSLKKEVNRLNNLVEKNNEIEDSLKGLIYDLQQTLKNKDKKIETLNNRLVFADSIVARLSNDCLRKKYDKIRVSQALANFEKMYSPELKSKFARLKFLLQEYGNYTQEIVDVFLEAQNDEALDNPFTGQKKALHYIDKIMETRYYQDVYNNNWTIPYLNKLIDKSFKVLKSYNPKESKELHLLDLMK